MKIRASFIFFVCAIGLFASPEMEKGFKGIKMGTTLREVSATYPPMRTASGPFVSAEPSGIVTVAPDEDTLAGVNATVFFRFVLAPELAPKDSVSAMASRISEQARKNLGGARLHSVSALFEQSDFRQVLTAVTARYGEPTTREIVDFKTRGGLEYTSEELTWTTPTLIMSLYERAGRSDRSRFSIGLKTPLPDDKPSASAVSDI